MNIEDQLVLVPEGYYTLGFKGYETRYLHNQNPKIVLHFSICDPGEHFGKILSRYYNVKRLIGKPRKSGKFAAGAKSHFLREFCSVAPVQIKRLDRIPVSYLENVLVKGSVKTVSQGSDQRTIPDQLRYSVVAKLEGPSND